MSVKPEDVAYFWLYEVGRDRWFSEDPALDTAIREKFLTAYEEAVAGKLPHWADNPEGTVALLLLLDQFPRRMFRGTSRAFETDDLALEIARTAIIKHFDDRIDRQFKML